METVHEMLAILLNKVDSTHGLVPKDDPDYGSIRDFVNVLAIIACITQKLLITLKYFLTVYPCLGLADIWFSLMFLV